MYNPLLARTIQKQMTEFGSSLPAPGIMYLLSVLTEKVLSLQASWRSASWSRERATYNQMWFVTKVEMEESSYSLSTLSSSFSTHSLIQ